jgi:hypothetical protein
MTRTHAFRRVVLATAAGAATLLLAACGEQDTASTPPANDRPATAGNASPGMAPATGPTAGTTTPPAGTAAPAESQAEAPPRQPTETR